MTCSFLELLIFFLSTLVWCPENCPQENCSPVRVSVWFRINIRIRAGGGGNFPWGQFFQNPLVYIYVLFEVYFSPRQRNISVNTNSKGNHEIKTKRYTFSLVSDIEVEFCLFCFFIQSQSPLQKQSSRGVLLEMCSKKFCKIHRKTPVPGSLF